MSGCAEPEPGLVHTAIASFQLGPQRSLAGLANCHGPGGPEIGRPRVGSGRPATVAKAWEAAASSRVAETSRGAKKEPLTQEARATAGTR